MQNLYCSECKLLQLNYMTNEWILTWIKKQTLILNCTQNLEYHLKSSEKVWTNLKALKELTIHLRRPWTSAFFRLASGTVGFSPRLKNSGHVITFLRRCGLQNTDHVMPFWPLKVDSLSHVFPAFVKVQRKERCPLYNLRSFTETTSKDAKCIEWKKKGFN